MIYCLCCFLKFNLIYLFHFSCVGFFLFIFLVVDCFCNFCNVLYHERSLHDARKRFLSDSAFFLLWYKIFFHSLCIGVFLSAISCYKILGAF